MIDIRKLKELVRLMVENDLTELDLRDSEEQVTMRRLQGQTTPSIVHTPVSTMHMPAMPPINATPVAPHAAGSQPGAAQSAVAQDEAGLIRIESPMVGTFYAQANPDTPLFVTPGASVTPDKVVCIIEAMKIFNEIKAECAGTIERMLVKNGEPVEFGQALFLVKPG